MPRPAELIMRLTDGSEFRRFTQVTLTESFADPIDRMTCTLRPGMGEWSNYSDKTRKGELIGMSVNDHAQAAMMIQTRTRRYGPNTGLVMTLSAVSTLQLLMEGFIEPKDSKRLDSEEPIIDLVSDIAAKFGFDEVQADQDVAAIQTKSGKKSDGKSKRGSEKKYKAAQSSGSEIAYSFLTRVLSRNGVMLRQHPEGMLILTAPHYDQKALYCLREPGSNGPDGDWCEGDIEETDSNEGQFSFVEVAGSSPEDDGETKTAAPTSRVESSAINSARPPFRATDFIKYKPRFYRDENAKGVDNAKHVATLILGRAAERAYALKVRVPALVSKDGVPWTVDTICRAYFPTLGVDEDMWIFERTMSQSVDGGQMTEITLLPKGYFAIGDESNSG